MAIKGVIDNAMNKPLLFMSATNVDHDKNANIRIQQFPLF